MIPVESINTESRKIKQQRTFFKLSVLKFLQAKPTTNNQKPININ